MRKMLVVGMVLVFAAGLNLTFGCASTRIKEVSGGDFLKHAQQTDVLGSFAWTSYIGSTHYRAYLEYGHLAFIGNGMQVTVFCTPLSELPSNIVTQIKSGVRPWTNAEEKIGQQTIKELTRTLQVERADFEAKVLTMTAQNKELRAELADANSDVTRLKEERTALLDELKSTRDIINKWLTK